MDEVTLDGKKYISSKLAAKKSGYAKDYVGQLCRGGKLDCRLVGRSWYVTEESVLSHAGKKTDEQKVEIHVEKETEIKVDHPQTIASVASIVPVKKDALSLPTWGEVKYSDDEDALIPILPVRENIESNNTNKDKVLSDRKNNSSDEHTVVFKKIYTEPYTNAKVLSDMVIPVPSRATVSWVPLQKALRKPRKSGFNRILLIIILTFILTGAILSIEQRVSYDQGSFFGKNSFGYAGTYLENVISNLVKTR